MKLFSSLKKQAQSYLEPYKQKEPATYAAAQEAVGGLLIIDGFTGIDNPFGGKKRPGIFGAAAGIIAGVVCMFVPMIFNGITGYDKMTATAEATVVSVGAPQVTHHTDSDGNDQTSTVCSLTAKFSAGGKDYQGPSTTTSSDNCSRTAGETVEINYNPENPNSWATNAKFTGIILSIFFWAGLFIVLSSLVTTAIRLLSIIFGWKILQSGRKLAATLPPGTNFTTMKNEIKEHFVGTLFNFGAGMNAAAANPLAGFNPLKKLMPQAVSAADRIPTTPVPPVEPEKPSGSPTPPAAPPSV